MSTSREHRIAPRLSSDLETEIRRVAGSTGLTGPPRSARLLNVSATGLQLAMPDPVLRGERLRVHAVLPDTAKESAEVGVYVVWSRLDSATTRNRYTCGAEYDPPNQSSAQWVLHQHRGRTAA